MSSIFRFPSVLPAFALAIATAHCGGRVASFDGDAAIPDRDAAIGDAAIVMADGDVDAARDSGARDSGVDAAPRPADASDALAWMRQAMVGTWRGVRTDPWDPPAEVVIHFDASGTYSAHCANPPFDGCVWHYGTDRDMPTKTYELVSVNGNGVGTGSIMITFQPTEALKGSLDAVGIDPTATEMTLDFYPTWLGQLGPVHFALTRVVP
jgi:hypothetical protein